MFAKKNYVLTIYKAFIRPYLDYGAVVYAYLRNLSFILKLESVQYNASLKIIDCFRDKSRDKLYSEFCLTSLADRWFYRRYIPFYKIVNKKAAQYLIDYLSTQDWNSTDVNKRPVI